MHQACALAGRSAAADPCQPGKNLGRENLAHLSTWFDLQPGDLIFTGTPAGVGPVLPGQKLVGGIEGLGELRVEVGPRLEQY